MKLFVYTQKMGNSEDDVGNVLYSTETDLHSPCVDNHQMYVFFAPKCRFKAEERAKRPQLSHMPFGFGPRNCIGMRFALLEAKMALIELLMRYTFVRAPDTEVNKTIVS